MDKYDVIVIGAGIAGLECASSLLSRGFTDFILLEQNPVIAKPNSWKTLGEVIEKYELGDCIATEISQIRIRLCNLKTKAIELDNVIYARDFNGKKCVILDAGKIYAKYSRILQQYMKLGAKVTKIEPVYDSRKLAGYNVHASGGLFSCHRIVDASGASNVTDALLTNSEWYKQSAYFFCYGKRFTNCAVKNVGESYFDFSDSLIEGVPTFCGNWYYPISEKIAEIGFSFYSQNRMTPYSNDFKSKADAILAKYMDLHPFRDIFNNAIEDYVISGDIPLLPRPYLKKGNIYYVGDTISAVPNSGAGVINALETARNVAHCISTGKKLKNEYTFSLAKSFLVFCGLWNYAQSYDKLFPVVSAINSLKPIDIFKFLTGKLDNSFYYHISKLFPKHGFTIPSTVSKGLLLRTAFNVKPTKSDYYCWAK